MSEGEKGARYAVGVGHIGVVVSGIDFLVPTRADQKGVH